MRLAFEAQARTVQWGLQKELSKILFGLARRRHSWFAGGLERVDQGILDGWESARLQSALG